MIPIGQPRPWKTLLSWSRLTWPKPMGNKPSITIANVVPGNQLLETWSARGNTICRRRLTTFRLNLRRSTRRVLQ
ncbi:GSCOCG00012289001-RA-CDS [Cotesia congregata]|nr:GSCOCG00012289001-RA-CDS [Cotesia congregata]